MNGNIFSVLPSEILIPILEQLSQASLSSFSSTCKAHRQFITNFDVLWKVLFNRDFGQNCLEDNRWIIEHRIKQENTSFFKKRYMYFFWVQCRAKRLLCTYATALDKSVKRPYDILMKLIFIGDPSISKSALLNAVANQEYTPIRSPFEVSQISEFRYIAGCKRIKSSLWAYEDYENYQKNSSRNIFGKSDAVVVVSQTPANHAQNLKYLDLIFKNCTQNWETLHAERSERVAWEIATTSWPKAIKFLYLTQEAANITPDTTAEAVFMQKFLGLHQTHWSPRIHSLSPPTFTHHIIPLKDVIDNMGEFVYQAARAKARAK